MKKSPATYVAQGALIAALYVILTEISAVFGLSGGAIQLRLSEALTILPLYLPSAIPGLFIGCIVSNLLTGCALWDIVFGSLATLIAAIVTSRLKRVKYLASIPPIVANTLVIPPIIAYVYGTEMALWLIYITVFLGELVSCGLLGTTLIGIIEKKRK
ncbi:MAG: QueT transporter family protein [Clostridia bacterium]|nr:QueT transporter family protein [Clostridia bacterium]